MLSTKAPVRKASAVVLVILNLLISLPSQGSRVAAQETQTLIINTIAGGGVADGMNARAASLALPSAIVVDASGNIFIADTNNHRIRKIDLIGNMSTVVGTGVAGYAGDGGKPEEAQLNAPRALAFDKDGNLLIADTGNHRIRRLEKAEDQTVINTFAGSGTAGFTGDGAAAKDAQINLPRGMAVDASGNLFFADSNNHRIRKVDSSGNITTYVGEGTRGFSDGGDDRDALKAQLNTPTGLAVNAAGDVFIADAGNNRIRKVEAASNKISTIAGTGLPAFSGDDGPAAQAALNVPLHVILDASGNIFIADSGNNRVRKIDQSGAISTVAGSGIRGMRGDGGPALQARFNAPTALAFAQDGSLLIADSANHRIRAVDASGQVQTVAGGGIGDGAPPLQAVLNLPYAVALDSSGVIYIADADHHRVRKFSLSETNPVISTVAGTGVSGFSGDGGQATEARLNFPRSIALDGMGNIYVADAYNHRIRKVDATGTISSVVGNGNAGFSGDGGSATEASLRFPLAVAVDQAGNLYISDSGNNRIRKVDTAGIIATAAGTGKRGSAGDDAPAVNAELNTPEALAFDKDGNLLIADVGNHRIRKLDFSTGNISTVAGKGTAAFSGDGSAATSAELNSPSGLAVDADGIIYVADTANHRVRKIDSTGNISTVTGTGTGSFGGDGQLASTAMLNFPTGLAVDKDKNLLIADTFNNRIRKITPQPATPTA